jgi:hypothetical protein
VCVYISLTDRICTPIDDELHRCNPYAEPPSDLAVAKYAEQPREGCRQLWRNCAVMSANAQADKCPTLSASPVKWHVVRPSLSSYGFGGLRWRS